jgi:hypothetical protein
MDIFLLPVCIIENKDLVLIIVCVWIASLLFTLEEKALKKPSPSLLLCLDTF